MKWYLTFALLLAGWLFTAGTASAQANPDGFERCGDPELVLVFLNPDLKVHEDGYVHASGTFFIQFQARGERAMEIEKFTFSFGKPTPGAGSCNTPEWITGAYIKNYRSDTDWRDGFFVPINTYNVGDGEYAAAVSAYDKDGNELVRYYTKALVENGGRQSGQDNWPVPDTTAPWPMVLPGDGERPDGKGGLYIEIAEEVTEVQAWVNGKILLLNEVQAPERDDDVVPDLGYGPLANDPNSEGQFKKRVYGPAFEWDGTINPSDVVKVRVVDMWGNVAEKVVHIGDPTIGGRVSAGKPEVDITLDGTEKTTDANGTAVWNVTYLTKTDDGIHGDLYLRTPDGGPVPEGLVARLRPNHVMMGGNEALEGTITIVAGPDAKTGAHDLVLALEYLSYDTRVEQTIPLRLVVGDRASSTDRMDDIASKEGTEREQVRGVKLDANADNATVASEPVEESGIPGPGALAALTGMGIAHLLRRRQRSG